MVRNAASMQSLRESMSDFSISSSKSDKVDNAPAPTFNSWLPPLPHPLPAEALNPFTFTSAAPPPPPPSTDADGKPTLERLNHRRSLQFLGQDAYTKSLMNRLATGQATEEEKNLFHEHIQQVNTHYASRLPSVPLPAGVPPLPSEVSHLFPGHSPEISDPPSRLAVYARRSNQYSQPPLESKAQQTSMPQHPVALPSPWPERERMRATRSNAEKYTKPFCDFLTDNPTVFHAVAALKKQLLDAGFKELSERERWILAPSGSYFVERNGSSLIAFTVGGQYKPANGAAIIAGHVDALTARLKPISQVPNKAGYLQLGVAPYAGGMNSTWWDRDLGIGGRVLIKENDKVVTKLVKLDWPIARIPTLAPHFGAVSNGPFNLETQTVPIIGLESTESSIFHSHNVEPFSRPSLLGGNGGSVGGFATTQPPALVKIIAEALGINSSDYSKIVNWELELFDLQPATVGGLNKEFIFGGRIDDKLCSWAALQALIEGKDAETENSSVIKVVALFDDEEIGSLLRQGARGNFLPITLERAVSSLAKKQSANLMGRTYANSFIVSSDVTHAVNPNFLNVYLENHAPHLNVGVAVSADPNGHMTTDAVSTAIFKACADKVGAPLQVFQIRNDSRSGGTVGPMLSSMTGIRAIDAGLPQLSMHSIRATTGSLDPGLGVITYAAFLHTFEEVDREFQS